MDDSAAPDTQGDLRARIVGGHFPVGTRLPSELELAAHYGVSRRAVRTALSLLARRGLVESRPGTGWFVQPGQTQGFDRMRSFTQWATSRGRTPGGRIVERHRRRATAREARLLDIGTGEDVLHFTRVRTLDGRPVMVERSTWAPWVLGIMDALPDDVRSTTRALAGEGIAVAFGNHRIEAAAASTDDARLLGVRRSSPLLQVRRETFASNGRPIEFAEDRYVPHTIAFEAQAAGVAEQPGAVRDPH
ncbi:GntR family transcriptional regulator [Microbacterium jejuense]|uniref:GntR family transcriptional regulator n=1 Tax=Microbacterium jejuense TaxID=1263637 RepID=UPI0031E58508